MDKNTFIEKILHSGSFDDTTTMARLYDKIVLAEKTGRTVFTSEFYPPNVWGSLLKLKTQFDVSFYTYGVFQDSERRIIGIANEEINTYDFPLELIKIKANNKFSSITHRDYLGSIMSLGIKREKFGDLILKNDSCYAAVQEEISDYLQFNLTRVKNSPCSVEVIDLDSEEKPVHEFEYINIISTSLRLDCMVGSICGISRSSSDDLIRQGKVMVDYVPVMRRDYILDIDNLIVIRGYGKLILNKITGATGSGRLRVQLKKYI